MDTVTVTDLIDWVYGQESRQDAVGAVARFVQGHVTRRPAVGSEPRWPSFEAMKHHARGTGPNVTGEQIDEAIAEASKALTLAREMGL